MAYETTVVTRTKDRPDFLKRAIQSVAKQTYNNYVHVIVNDGGDNHEIDMIVAEQVEEVRRRILVFHRNVTSGAPDTIFNESIDRVQSTYIAIHDDDDTWEPDFLSISVRHMEEHPEIGATVARANKIIEVVGRNGSIRPIKVRDWMPDMKVISLYRQCIDNQFTPIATVIRRDAYEAIGKFDCSLPVIGDWEFGIRLLQRYDADFIDPGYPLAHYHHRKMSAAQKRDGSFDNHSHRYYFNKVANTYLRSEMKDGVFGPGYIMSKIKYDQSYLAQLIGNILPAKLTDVLKNRVRK